MKPEPARLQKQEIYNISWSMKMIVCGTIGTILLVILILLLSFFLGGRI